MPNKIRTPENSRHVTVTVETKTLLDRLHEDSGIMKYRIMHDALLLWDAKQKRLDGGLTCQEAAAEMQACKDYYASLGGRA